MAQGIVAVNNLNLGQGDFPEIERTALFIGVASKNVGKILSLNTQSDLDDELGSIPARTEAEIESGLPGMTQGLRAQLGAAKLNAGENWQAYAAPIAAGSDWRQAALHAIETANVSPEIIAVCVPVTTAADVMAGYNLSEVLRTQYARRVIVLMAARGIVVDHNSGSPDGSIPPKESWSDYLTAMAAITEGVSAYRVGVVPLLHNNDLGALVGRLCNRSVSIADSPMRVSTGPVIGLDTVPTDIFLKPLPSAVLSTLDQQRFSVPQRYVDYPGTYWGDCNLLDDPAGDFQVIENLRVVDKAARAIRILAIRRVANRMLNETPGSIAAAKTYFMRPLREMSRSVQFAGEVFPGDIVAPSEDSITIVWPSRTHVEIYIKIQPYNSPKSITANIILDLKAL